MDIKGKVKVIMDTQTFDSGFTKREFVITTDEQYPQDVKFETVKDKTALLDKYKEGDGIIVHFNIRGNEYNGKYYVSLQAWRIEADSSSGVEDGQNIEPKPMVEEEDDLPF